jgi:hypothetical protein
MQALGSPFLQNHGLRLLRAARAVVASPGDGTAAGSFRVETDRLEQRHAVGVSCTDLLASAAEVEASRLTIGERLEPSPAHRQGFDWLASRLGADDAYELMGILTFLAFITDHPCEWFAKLAESAAHDTEPWKHMAVPQILDRLGWTDGVERYLDLVAAGEPVGTPYVANWLGEAARRLGRWLLLEVLGRPAVHLSELDESRLRRVFPPVNVYPSRAGGMIIHRNGVALDADSGFAGDALSDVALVGAAALLLGRSEPSYCNHERCPVHPTATCRHWYAPPDTETGHQACHFIKAFTHWAGTDPVSAYGRR